MALTGKSVCFDTIVGYESTTAGNNPNYSKSYGYNIEPTTHTGILGNLQNQLTGQLSKRAWPTILMLAPVLTDADPTVDTTSQRACIVRPSCCVRP